jgi:hypothetical protein
MAECARERREHGFTERAGRVAVSRIDSVDFVLGL